MLNFAVLMVLLCGFLFTAFHVNAQKPESRRPKIGLVLSGGGARGLAHIGVIKILEQYGIQVDYVVGTSMGSLVGGLYASGYDAAALEKTALTIDWDYYLNDTISRRDLSYDEKKDDGRFMVSIPFYKKVEAPRITGVIEGVKLHSLLNRLLSHVRTVRNFNDLSIPFACVATDIYTGDAVILKRGHLPTALRASMSIPSIFSPVEIDGRLLVDGGLVLNFPVSVAREMGADIIIGVDVGTPLYKKGEVLTIPKIIDQMSSFKGADSTKKQRELCDILITPDLDGFYSTDFDRTAEFIAQGEKAAILHAGELQALADEQNRAGVTRREKVHPDGPDEKILISGLRVEGLKNVSSQMLDSRLQLDFPSFLAVNDIENAVSRAYGSRFFKSVTYRIDQEGPENFLVIKVEETAVDFFNVGIRYDSDLLASILLNAEFKNILGEGSRLDIEARLGENPAFYSGYRSGTGWPVGFGFGSEIWFESIEAYTYVNSDVSGEHKFTAYGMNLFSNMLVYHDFELGLGLRKEFIRIDDVISLDNYSRSTADYLNPYIFIHLDTIDRSSFPGSGIIVDGEAMYISSTLSIIEAETISAQRYFLNTGIYIPLHARVTFVLNHFIGVIQGEDAPVVYFFSIGGMNTLRNIVFPFVGLNYMEALGTNINAAGAGLQVELFKNFFITPRANAARIKDSTKDVVTGNINTVYGYGLTAGYLSLIGPIQATISRGSNHEIHFHFNIGFMF